MLFKALKFIFSPPKQARRSSTDWGDSVFFFLIALFILNLLG